MLPKDTFNHDIAVPGPAYDRLMVGGLVLTAALAEAMRIG